MKVMNAEVFAEGLEKCRLFTTLLGQNVKNLDVFGCPKFKTLSKGTVGESARVTFSDTKPGVTVPRIKQMCMENGLCNVCNFLYVCIVFVFISKVIFFNST